MKPVKGLLVILVHSHTSPPHTFTHTHTHTYTHTFTHTHTYTHTHTHTHTCTHTHTHTCTHTHTHTCTQSFSQVCPVQGLDCCVSPSPSLLISSPSTYPLGETSKTTVKKSMQKASQVYLQQSEQWKPRSAAAQSLPRSSQSRVQSSKKTPGSTHLKSKSCYSQLHSVKKISKGLSDACQRKSSAPVEGKGMEGGAGGNEKGRTRPEWRSVVPDNLVQSEVDEVPGVSRLPQGKSSQVPACKDTGLAEKEDKMKGHFRISEHG